MKKKTATKKAVKKTVKKVKTSNIKLTPDGLEELVKLSWELRDNCIATKQENLIFLSSYLLQKLFFLGIQNERE